QLRDEAVIETAGAALGQANVVIRDYALRYFEDTRAKTGIPRLLPLLDDTDKETQERVISLVSRFGQAVVRPLLQSAKTATRLWQLNAARILCAVHSNAAWKALLQLLSQGDSEFNRVVCDLMVATLRELSEDEQTELYTEVEAFARTLDEDEQRVALISAIRLLGQLGRAQSRKWLSGFVEAEHHHSLR